MRLTISAILLLVVFSVPRAHADKLLNAITALPADVVQMRSGGVWKGGGETGYLRFFIARAAPGAQASRFFVQWIRGGGAEAVVATREIVEVARTPQRLTDFRVQVGSEGTDVFIDTLETGTGIEGEYMLLLGGPGAYEFSLLGN